MYTYIIITTSIKCGDQQSPVIYFIEKVIPHATINFIKCHPYITRLEDSRFTDDGMGRIFQGLLNNKCLSSIRYPLIVCDDNEL